MFILKWSRLARQPFDLMIRAGVSLWQWGDGHPAGAPVIRPEFGTPAVMAGAVMAWRGVVNSARVGLNIAPSLPSFGRLDACAPVTMSESAGRTTKMSGGWRGSNSKCRSNPFVVRGSGFYRAWAAGMTVLARKYRAGGYFAPFPVWMSGLMKLSGRERDFFAGFSNRLVMSVVVIRLAKKGGRVDWRISSSPVVIVARGSMLQNNGGAVFCDDVEWCNPSYTLFHVIKNEKTRTGAPFSGGKMGTICDSGNQKAILSPFFIFNFTR
jgi:hypothetical protein